MRKLNGLTLIELAIILVIIGIFMGIGMSAFLIYVKNMKTSITKNTVQSACEAVKGYISTHYLIPSNLSSLGIKTKDTYEENLIYKINTSADAYTSNNICSQSPNSNNTLTINIYSNASTIESTKSNIAFAIYSKGENRVDNTNPDGDNTLDIRPYGIDNYDDIICYYDINSLKRNICPPPLTVSGNSPVATEDKYYEASINVNGGQTPYSYTWTGLSCGLTATNDKIHGQINCDTSSTDGKLSSCTKTLNLTVNVEDSLTPAPHNIASANFNLTVKAQPPYVFETVLPDATECLPYSVSLTGKGGNGSYTWNIDSNNLPSGLSTSNNTISGMPNSGTTGNYRVSVSLTSCNETTTTQIPLKVNPNPVKIDTITLPYAYKGNDYRVLLQASGGAGGYTWQLINNGGVDIVIDSNGVLRSDDGTIDTAEGTYKITVRVTDSCAGSIDKTFALTIVSGSASAGGGSGSVGVGSCPTLSLNPSPGTYTANLGTFYSLSISPSGGVSPYTNTLCTPSSCAGLTLICSSSNAIISGKPTGSAICNFQVGYSDSCSTKQTTSGVYTINITCPTLSLSSNLPAVNLCSTYKGSITANGGISPYNWSYTGNLPLNISFCSGNTKSVCSLSGLVIDDVGAHTFNVSVQDSCPQIVTRSFSISVNPTDMTGIRRGRDCSTSGITVREEAEGRLYYMDNNNICRKINRDKFYPGKVYTIYTDDNCTNVACSLNFCDLWNAEKGNIYSNCDVRITGYNGTTCSFGD